MSYAALHRMLWAGFLLGLAFSSVAHSALRDFDGQDKELADFKGSGKWLVVMIWASDCHVCNGEAYQYVDFHEMNEDGQASVLGISMDGQAGIDDAIAFVERHSVTFPNLIGEPRDVARLYTELTGESFVGTPSLIIFDPSGQLRARQAGAVPTTVIEDFIRRESAQIAAP